MTTKSTSWIGASVERLEGLPLVTGRGREGGVAGVGAVVASAVDDALGGLGRVTRIPITPQFIKSVIDGLEVSAATERSRRQTSIQ